MRLFLNLLSLGLLGIGYLENTGSIATWGSIVFLISQVFYLRDAFLYSKKIANNAVETDTAHKSNFIDHARSFSEGAIIVFGLIALVLGNELTTSGAIIWFGAIFVYFLWGVIIELFTGIPLRFGYGGWQVRNKRYRKK